ncbi:MAG: hypothetical protein IJA34_17715 [Lachnospiraceae bacterium]|nr:hypothetical protein [Lachnospiraceae bacterium]
MIDSVRLKLQQGQYTEVEEICKEMNLLDFRDVFMNIAYETESINVYGFIVYMIRSEGNKEWIKLAIDILLNSLCFIEGAYSLALFHVRELLKIDRNVENLERILFFYNIPEKLVDDIEAYKIAEEILAIDADNVVALKIKYPANSFV